ncbi:MAG: hypothetical protein JSV03_11615 [Planctomycetota bacterium]|nr:MAG: hypothetical protein JSV03_11615 [Planctomycetota bacterium]
MSQELQYEEKVKTPIRFSDIVYAAVTVACYITIIISTTDFSTPYWSFEIEDVSIFIYLVVFLICLLLIIRGARSGLRSDSQKRPWWFWFSFLANVFYCLVVVWVIIFSLLHSLLSGSWSA